MTNSPASLVSDRARALFVEDPAPRGFWQKVKAFAGIDKPNVDWDQVPETTTLEDCLRSGYEVFCRFGGGELLVRETEGQMGCLLHDSSGANAAWLEQPPKEYCGAEVGILATLYVSAVGGDGELSADESAALLAVTRLFRSSASTLLEVKRKVVEFIVMLVTNDLKVTAGEANLLDRVKTILNISESDAHLSALAVFNLHVGRLMSEERIAKSDVDRLESTGRALEIPAVAVAEGVAKLEEALFYQDCMAGNMPVVDDPPVNLKRREVAHWCGAVEVGAVKTVTRTHRGYAGTRVKLGKLPLYFGGSTPFKTSHKEWQDKGVGIMAITNQRVVVAGTELNYSIALDRILAVEEYTDGIQIQSEGRYGGRLYMMEDARRAYIILQALISREDG